MAPMIEKEWTLMVYFASDTTLAPEIVSQLKSIKQAGFHQDANVIAQFDPNPENAETHIFDINRINKIQARGKNKIGFIGFTPNDPFVVNLMTDKLWRKDSKEGPIRERIIDSLNNLELTMEREFEFDPPEPPPVNSIIEPDSADKSDLQNPTTDIPFNTSNELTPQESLTNFLKFCSDNYPARHYMLFILGHGVVVGNDTFLFDEHAPVHSLQLRTLRVMLETFKKDIKTGHVDDPGPELELISFHSCSMGSLEVASELQGLANYMLASQSPSFVGSWPYRQILIRIFNYLERKEANVKKLVKNIFHYCLYNSNDFLVAGYSCDGGLCDLNKVSAIEGATSDLAAKLIAGLNSEDVKMRELIQERIVLAHLDAQSYFNENYVDQFDFCFRLQQRIESTNQKPLPSELQAISTACLNVMNVLKKGVEGNDDQLIIRSEFIGPAFQYSHGLSVYFPWFRPMKSEFWPQEYNKYKFVKARADANETSWSDFLKHYFDVTRRHTRMEEFTKAEAPGFENEIRRTGQVDLQDDLLEAFSTAMFNANGQLSKPGPDSSQGAGCDCQSIKNYPPFTREPQQSGVAAGSDARIPVSQTLLRDPSFTLDKERRTFVLDGLIE
jgi:hypothetical protein